LRGERALKGGIHLTRNREKKTPTFSINELGKKRDRSQKNEPERLPKRGGRADLGQREAAKNIQREIKNRTFQHSLKEVRPTMKDLTSGKRLEKKKSRPRKETRG